MDKFYNATLYKLETAISELEIEADCSPQRIETVIHLIVNSGDVDPVFWDVDPPRLRAIK